jgi:hypothetical protein
MRPIAVNVLMVPPMSAEEAVLDAVTPKQWRVPSKNTLIERNIEVIKYLDSLPDSANVALEVCCAVDGICMATGFRLIQRGLWPALEKNGTTQKKMNLGKWRRARAAIAAAGSRRKSRSKTREAVAA